MNLQNNQRYLPATFWRRFMALIYDILIIISLMLVVTAIVVALVGAIYSKQALENGMLDGNIFFRLMLLSVWFVYYGLSWTRGGQTLGMKPWRLYTVKENGKNLNWKDSVLRFMTGMMGLGLLFSIYHPQNKSLQDIISKTKTLHQSNNTK